MVTPTSVLAEPSKSYPFLCSPEHIAGLRKYLMVCIRVHVCAHTHVYMLLSSHLFHHILWIPFWLENGKDG